MCDREDDEPLAHRLQLVAKDVIQMEQSAQQSGCTIFVGFELGPGFLLGWFIDPTGSTELDPHPITAYPIEQNLPQMCLTPSL